MIRDAVNATGDETLKRTAVVKKERRTPVVVTFADHAKRSVGNKSLAAAGARRAVTVTAGNEAGRQKGNPVSGSTLLYLLVWRLERKNVFSALHR